MGNALQMLEIYLPILPEIILAVGAMVALLFGVFRGEDSASAVSGFSLALIAVAAVCLVTFTSDEASLFGGSFVLKDYGRFMKLLVLAGTFFVLFMSIDSLRENRLLSFEFPVLILFAATGMMVMVSAGDLITLYLGLELQSLALYVIAAYRRDSVRSSEAGLKYFVLGALSSGMLLYGSSLIYGYTGSVHFPAIANVVQETGLSLGLVFGLVFLLSGLAFKISAVPFHMWTPDVYEGAPTPVTAFFAGAPKIAAMALIVRVTIEAFPAITKDWQQIVVFLSIASMVLGAFAAIGQNNIKRLMAYSSIGHMGFALVGLAAGSEDGVRGVIIYLAIYLVMTLGTFACILAMKRSEGAVENIDELSGLAQNNLPMAFFLAVLLFSLAGVPPLAGFFAKFYVFLAAINAGLYPLAVIGVLASVVGAYYYLRIVKVMFFDDPVECFEPIASAQKVVLVLSGIFVLCYAVYPSPLIAAAAKAAKTLF